MMEEPEILSSESQLQGRITTLYVQLSRPSVQAALNAAIMLLAFIIFMGLVQFSTPDLPDNDGYYHIRLAYLMRTEGLKPSFPYLPLSILNVREFSDHHFLFHVALIPFTFGDLRLGAKWAPVFFAGLAFLSVWWLLYRQKVPYAGLWALGLLAISEGFLFRMSIARAQSLSLAVLALGLSFLLEKRYILLAPLAFIYVWLYDAFPLIMVVASAYFLAVLLLERRLEWRPLVYTGAGILLGLLINPYFPHNLVFLFRHLLPKLDSATAINVGIEWYPYDTQMLLRNAGFALVAFVGGVLALGLNKRRMDVRTATSLFLTVIFGLMLFQARRFIEYFPAFTLIFAAFAWAPLIYSWQKRNLGSPLDKATDAANQKTIPVWQHLPAIVLIAIMIVGMGFSLCGTVQDMRSSKSYSLFAGASAWLEHNTPSGSLVFQTDWDDFPRLFFYNTHNTYLIGLDPTYMQLYNADLYDRWVAITRGQVTNPSQEIYDRFSARYVVSDTLHGNFIKKAQTDPAMQEVYRDNMSVVYRITE